MAFATLTTALPAQAGCTVWRALADRSDEHLEDIVLQFGEGRLFEIAHLGVVDSLRGAESCELSVAYGGLEFACDWPDESEEAALARLETIEQEIATCLAASFAPRPDREFAETGGARLHRRELEIAYDEGLEISFELRIYRSGRIATDGRYYALNVQFRREER